MPTPPEHAQCVSTPDSENFIETLPEELLIMIVEEIDDRWTWNRLCRVNKRFKRIAEKYLYSRLKFFGYRKDLDYRNPLVSKYVLSLELHGESSLEDDWLLVLHHARNLQVLTTRTDGRSRAIDFLETEFVPLAMQTNPVVSKPLPQLFFTLKVLDVGVSWELIEGVLFLFGLPHLDSLTLRTFYQERAFDSAILRRLDCKLRSLSLHAFLCPEAWAQLLSVTTGLKEFTYVYDEDTVIRYNENMIPDWAFPDLPAVVDALGLQKDSLEVIYIEDRNGIHFDEEFMINGQNYCKGLSPLKDFSRLKSLRAPLRALMDRGSPDLSLSLPPQLEVLATDVGRDTAKLSSFDSVFESLTKVFPSTGPRQLGLSFALDYPFVDVKISPSLRTLEKYGVSVCLNFRNSYRGIFDLTEMEEREAGLINDLEVSSGELDSEGWDLEESDLEESDLEESDLQDSGLEESDLEQANLEIETIIIADEDNL